MFGPCHADAGMRGTLVATATVTNTAIVKRLYSEVLNQGRLDVADDLATDDVVSHNTPDPSLRGPLSLETTARLLRSGFSDLQFHLEDIVAENDRVAVRWLTHGVHSGEYVAIPATGRNLRNVAPQMILRPSFRRFALANFAANGISAQPTLHRLAWADTGR